MPKQINILNRLSSPALLEAISKPQFNKRFRKYKMTNKDVKDNVVEEASKRVKDLDTEELKKHIEIEYC